MPFKNRASLTHISDPMRPLLTFLSWLSIRSVFFYQVHLWDSPASSTPWRRDSLMSNICRSNPGGGLTNPQCKRTALNNQYIIKHEAPHLSEAREGSQRSYSYSGDLHWLESARVAFELNEMCPLVSRDRSLTSISLFSVRSRSRARMQGDLPWFFYLFLLSP